MEVTFNEKYLQDLYEKGKADKKHRFQPHIVRKYGDIVNLMKREANVLELLKYKSLNYEKLKGDKVGLIYKCTYGYKESNTIKYVGKGHRVFLPDSSWLYIER